MQRPPLKSLLPPVLLLCLVAITYFLYQPAFSAGFNFDDVPNLYGLNHLDPGNPEQVFNFIFHGINNGGLGRPIAYASFVFQAPNWPSDPTAFIRANTLLHLINGLLVAWLALRLHSLVPTLTLSRQGFAVSLAAAWLMQPLLASASLLVVQRMTTLATSFMLAGMIAYLAGRQKQESGDPRGWFLMLGGAGLGTLLAAFTKESGALLPLYLWVLEMTLLQHLTSSPWIRPWRYALALPGVLLAFYCLAHWGELEASFNNRTFTLYERLLTETRILANYVLLVFIPNRGDLGPFHDDYIISHSLLSPPSTLFCAFGWLAAFVFALLKRRRFPVPAFGIGWFLVGHALESTVFNLELYFEHRNYLPSIGPLLMLCQPLWQLPAKRRAFPLAAFVCYLGLQGFVLHEQTLVWGNPRLAAELWLAKHPLSERARQHLAQQYLLLGDEGKTLQTLLEGFRQNRKTTAIALQVIQIACYRDDDVGAYVSEIIPTLQQGDRSYAALDALQKLANKALSDHSCPGFNVDTLHLILDKLIANDQFQSDKAALAELHKLKARIHLKAGELEPVILHMESAFQARPEIDTAMLIIGYLDSAGLYDVAQEKLADFRARIPANPVLKSQWKKRLDDAEASLQNKAKEAAGKQ